MKWEEVIPNYIEAEVEAASSRSLVELWQQVLDYVLPKHKSNEWDFVKVEFWADSGRVIIFPSLSGSSKRVDKAGCQLIDRSFLSKWEDLCDQDIDDDQFTELALKLELDYAVMILQSLKSITSHNDVEYDQLRVVFYDADELDPIFESPALRKD